MNSAIGIVLFAHGSRDERWRAPVEAVARRITDMDGSVRVMCAYLEFVSPDLQTAATVLVSHGVRHIRVVPLFLGMGKHVREDLPRLMHELCSAHPAVAFSLQEAVGESPDVIDLLARVALSP